MFLSIKELENIGFKSVGHNVLISDKCSIYNAKNIEIGNNVRIDDFTILSAGDGGIKIGSHIHIACYTSLIGKGKILVDDFSNISSKVTILSSSDDFSGEFLIGPCINTEFTNVKSATIHLMKHSVIGTGSTILPGVTIKEGGAVGAMSLVKNDVEEFEIVVGTPAKKVKDRSKNILDVELKYLETIEYENK
jgi:acetyltransferase-like isoleucine patch superfamily enzyme